MAENALSIAAPNRRALFGLALGIGLTGGMDVADAAASPWDEIESELAEVHPEWWRRVRLANQRQEAAYAEFDAESRAGGFARLLVLEDLAGVNAADCDHDLKAQRINEIGAAVACRSEMDPDALRIRTILAVINHHQIDDDSAEVVSLVLLLAEATGAAALPWLSEEIHALRHYLAKASSEALTEAVAA